MLIKQELVECLKKNNILVRGVLHVGAHNCEELDFYTQKMNLQKKDIIWIEAIPQKVTQCTKNGIPNVFNAIVSDVDGKDISFNIANNGQSSSILEFGTHKTAHPWVKYVGKIKGKTTTLNSFIKNNNINMYHNFWNFDIQGAELLALKGATEYIDQADALYLEVNEKELYLNCGLISDIDNFLKKYNFKRVLTKMTPHGWGDALYIKNKL